MASSRLENVVRKGRRRREVNVAHTFGLMFVSPIASYGVVVRAGGGDVRNLVQGTCAQDCTASSGPYTAPKNDGRPCNLPWWAAGHYVAVLGIPPSGGDIHTGCREKSVQNVVWSIIVRRAHLGCE